MTDHLAAQHTKHRHIIAILRGITSNEVPQVCAALVEAGISMIEITLNSPDPLPSIEMAVQLFAADTMIGAGTVLTPEQVDQVADVGGLFVVSPECFAPVIKRTIERGMRSYPGVFTATEAFAALRAGATGLKFFPCELIGPTGIAAMKAVLPSVVPIYAVGGANPGNFRNYFEAGCTGFGLGSYLYKPGRDAVEVSKRAQQAVATYDRWQSS